jgi:hypothetical protein
MKVKFEWCDDEGTVYFTQDSPTMEIGDTITVGLKPMLKNRGEGIMTDYCNSYFNEILSSKLTRLNLKIAE